MFDVFVDNDDRSKLRVWVNRDYSPLRSKVGQLRSLRHALEKEELKYLRAINKKHRRGEHVEEPSEPEQSRPATAESESGTEAPRETDNIQAQIATLFELDQREYEERRLKYPKLPEEATIRVVEQDEWYKRPSKWSLKSRGQLVTKVAWLRAEITYLSIEVEEMLRDLDNESRFKRQNSAFIQFDRQMSANMACGLVTHERPGCMTPRFLDVAPHEIIWSNMGLTSWNRFIRACFALVLFVGMVFLWGIPV